MKRLELNQMEVIEGKGLTKREIEDFLGAGSCIAMFAGGPFAILTAASCIYWITGG